MIYTIRATSADVEIGGFTFTSSPIRLIEIPILTSDNFESLFDAVENSSLTIAKDGEDLINPMPIISNLINLAEGFETIMLSDGSDLLNEYRTKEYEREDIHITDSTITVLSDDFSKYFTIKGGTNYDVILPDVNTVSPSSVYKFKNLDNNLIRGTFTPVSGQNIEGQDLFYLYGKGYVSLKVKTDVNTGVPFWSIVDFSSLFSSLGHGETKHIDFVNNDGLLVVEHNLGYTPTTQVWVNDGLGGFTDPNVDVDHASNKDSFTVNLEGVNSGFVLYV